MYSAQMVYKNTILNECYIAPHLVRLSNLKERQLLDNKIAVSGFLHNIYALTMSLARGTLIFYERFWGFFGDEGGRLDLFISLE